MKQLVLWGLASVLSGCVLFQPARKREVQWPDEHSAKSVMSAPLEAGAALAAAGAIREMVKNNPYPDLFEGCSSPEQGLDVVVFTGPTPGLYYVVLHSRFDRCGGPVERVLDGWDVYAVTSQGEVIAKAPPPTGDESVGEPVPSQPPPEQPLLSPTQAVPPLDESPATAPLVGPPASVAPGAQPPANPP